jgi:hypothetical protein
MGAFDQFRDQSQQYGDQAKGSMGGKRRRGQKPEDEERMMGSERPESSGRSERPMPRGERPERGGGAEFDERAQQRAQQRMRDAEAGEDDNDWA